MASHEEATAAAASGSDYLTALPLDVLEGVLLLLGRQDLAAASLTCHTLHNFITSDSFMLRMFRQHIGLSSADALAMLKLTQRWPWSQRACLCFENPFGTNLLLGGSAGHLQGHEDSPYGRNGREKLKEIPHWRVLSNGGDGWQVERPPIGADPVPQQVADEGDALGGERGGCYVTSYTDSCKEQLVDFRKLFSKFPRLIDALQPVISVSEWVAGRHDCDSCYRLQVDLLSRKGRVLHTWDTSVDLGPSYTGTKWVQVSHEFRQYGRGLAAARFRHSGRDRRMWAGWYGPKMTGASVKLRFEAPREEELRRDESEDEGETDYDGEIDFDFDDYMEQGYDDEDEEEDGDEDNYNREPPAPGYFQNIRNFFKF